MKVACLGSGGYFTFALFHVPAFNIKFFLSWIEMYGHEKHCGMFLCSCTPSTTLERSSEQSPLNEGAQTFSGGQTHLPQ